MDSTNLVTVRAKPSAGDIFAYKMYHTFVCVAGVGRLIFSAIFLALGIGTLGSIDTYLSVIVLGIGLLNVLFSPLLFAYQAIKAAPALQPINYTFSEDKIVANDGKNRVELPWTGLALVVWLRKELLIYTSPREALVVPRRQMEGRDAEVLAIIKAHGNPSRTVIRKIW